MRTLFVSLLISTLGAAAATAETYKVSLAQPTEINGHRLAAGSYKVEVAGSNAYFAQGKLRILVPVHAEAGSETARTTNIRYDTADGTYRLREISPKGSAVKLSFGEQTAAR